MKITNTAGLDAKLLKELGTNIWNLKSKNKIT
jgi:hypothetical protein